MRGLVIALCCWASALGASGKQRLDDFLSGLKTLEAAFTQAVLDTENNRTGEYRGIFRLSRPGRFRWDYALPYEQSIIADGKDVWIVDSDLEQITQRNQKAALKGTPAALLAEEVDLEAEFQVVDLGERVSLEWLELLPRDEDSEFVRILLAFHGNELRRMEMADKFGQVTRFRFFDVLRNPELDPAVFHFVRPPAYDLYTQ